MVCLEKLGLLPECDYCRLASHFHKVKDILNKLFHNDGLLFATDPAKKVEMVIGQGFSRLRIGRNPLAGFKYPSA